MFLALDITESFQKLSSPFRLSTSLRPTPLSQKLTKTPKKKRKNDNSSSWFRCYNPCPCIWE
jgi:hypothetical protein